ncbi:MAG: TRAP transporter permease [Armatimonadota bacterium]|nr:TRAP transporter permease [Armatimonadota bacterium]MDR7486349.1 TRAP transporter permease [Armatimonadota bacterium]MDR7534226.1 TRAP transporter permease [Armatimonadota bacterium]MDR7536758.1 TRAP transporter permease [Armatimonadota bacterium]
MSDRGLDVPGRFAAAPEPPLADVETLLREVEPEYNYRRLAGFWAGVVASTGVAMALFHLYTARFGALEALRQRAVHLAFAFTLVFLLYPPRRRGAATSRIGALDLLMVAAALLPMLYVFYYHADLAQRAGNLSRTDMVIGVLGVLVVLEAGRRLMAVVPLIAALALVYPFLGQYLPGALAIARISPQRVIEQMFFTTEGVFGIPVGVSATFVFLFVLLGAFLERTGLGQLFVDIAMALAGWMTGGPAKVSVLSSAFIGTVSGSSVANVVADGVFNIPLMRRLGYHPRFAAGVEAATSVGGQLVPPVMGAAAFVMAEFLGVPYLTIVKAAVIPAALYYLSLALIIHFEAKRLGLAGLPRDQLPSLRDIVVRRFYLVLPLVVLVGFLLHGASPMRAAFWGIVVSAGVHAVTCVLERRPLDWLRDVWTTLAYGARLALPVAVATAVVGIFIGIVTLTGLGLAFVSLTITLGQGILFLTLIWIMIACTIVGSGIPTTATYIILAAIAAPALVQMGVPALAAHLFIFYFGVLADITPPDALAAYAAAGIARTDPFQTGLTATRLALAGIIIPYVFVYSPTILMQGAELSEIAITTATAVVGVVALSAAIAGYLFGPARALERVLLGLTAVALIFHDVRADVAGLGLLAAVVVVQVVRRRAQGPAVEAAARGGG